MKQKLRNRTIWQIIASAGDTSAAQEYACELSRTQSYEVTVIVWLKSPPAYSDERDVAFIYLNAKHSLDPLAFYRFYRLLARKIPDVLHVHHTCSAFLAAFLGNLKGVENIYKTEHTNHGRLQVHQHLLNAGTFALCKGIVCNSHTTYDSMRSWESPFKHKAKVIYNGVVMSRLNENRSHSSIWRKKYNIGNKRMIAVVARWVPVKNLLTPLRALAKLKNELNDFHFILAGEGEERTRIERCIHEQNLSDYVSLPGLVNRSEAYQIMHEADIFVVSSWWEGFCNAAVEAMVARCMLVCSDIETLHEVVGPDAFYASTGSVDDFADRLRKCLLMPDETLEKYKTVLHERAVLRYDMTFMQNRHLEEYEDYR